MRVDKASISAVEAMTCEVVRDGGKVVGATGKDMEIASKAPKAPREDVGAVDKATKVL